VSTIQPSIARGARPLVYRPAGTAGDKTFGPFDVSAWPALHVVFTAAGGAVLTMEWFLEEPGVSAPDKHITTKTWNATTEVFEPTRGPWVRISLAGGSSGLVVEVVRPFLDNSVPQVVARHGARVHRTTNKSIPNNALTTVDFQAELYDTDGYWSVGNATRLIVPAGLGGLYLVFAQLNYAVNANGRRALFVLHEPSAVYVVRTQMRANTDQTEFTLTSIFPLAAGDALLYETYQDSGAALNLLGDGNPVSAAFAIERIAA
jgi:hypothetical protein